MNWLMVAPSAQLVGAAPPQVQAIDMISFVHAAFIGMATSRQSASIAKALNPGTFVPGSIGHPRSFDQPLSPAANAVEVTVMPDEEAVPVVVVVVVMAMVVVVMAVVVMMAVVVVMMVMAVAAVASQGLTGRGDGRETEGRHGSQGKSGALEHLEVPFGLTG